LELYNEEVHDLLAANPKNKLILRENAERQFYVQDLKQFPMQNPQEMIDTLNKGRKNRVSEFTNMNDRSSRSHAIFTITIEMAEIGVDGKSHIRVGKLNLVDLAGSERHKNTGTTGQRFTEGVNINKSLTTLGNVIHSLTDNNCHHVPYRESNLTRMLQDSLGGNTKTVMIANIGPSQDYYEESMSTLRYASRAKSIKNKPKINEDPKDTMLREF
jgi:kinesin family protein 3/17